MISSIAMSLLAQTTVPVLPPAGAAATSRPAPEWLQMVSSPMFLIVLLFIVFWFFMMGGKRKDEKKRQDMLGGLKKGDRIQTIGGVLGTVVEAREGDVVVKVDESNNTKIRFSRSAIHRVLEEESK